MKDANDMRGEAVRTKIAALLAVAGSAASALHAQVPVMVPMDTPHVVVGAERTSEYLPLLAGRRVALVTNHTGRIGHVHLVDTLPALGVNVVKVFAPEHGFRGDADAGAPIADQRDAKSGLPVLSLYGRSRKPTPQQLADVDVLLFDVQDVGVRFYTYISTLHHVMEAAAENGKALIVLDRPNPNGFYVDGPVLDPEHASFVGMHPVPLVHGMTIGEYARMIDGEGWLKGGLRCRPVVIPCVGYTHHTHYVLPVPPSPNLPNMAAVHLYPSLGLFEGTIVSVGRGTPHPFQCIGYPGNPVGRFSFTPQPMPGAQDPPHNGRICTGFDLRAYGGFQSRLDRAVRLHWLIGLYQEAPDRQGFFLPNGFFDKLAGGPTLRQQVQAGMDEEAIRATWRPGLEAFLKTRAKYLLYPDSLR